MKTVTLTIENDADEQLLLKLVERFNIKVENLQRKPDTAKILDTLKKISNLPDSGFSNIDPIQWQNEVREDRNLPSR